jgi:hypothetical protein
MDCSPTASSGASISDSLRPTQDIELNFLDSRRIFDGVMVLGERFFLPTILDWITALELSGLGNQQTSATQRTSTP